MIEIRLSMMNNNLVTLFDNSFHLVPFYLMYFIVSLVEDCLKLVTFYFRVDMLSLGTIFAKIILEIVYSRTLA